MSPLHIDQAAQDLLYLEAHTPTSFNGAPVSDQQIRDIWQLMKFAPTANNSNPLRIVVIKSPEARERLLPHMAPGNVPKVTSAPISLILAADTRFHEYMPQLAPHAPQAFEQHEARTREEREATAQFSALLQAGYLVLAVRAAGLNAAPMLGFDKAGVDAEFFADGRLSALFVMSIGQCDADQFRPRSPRLAFDEVVTVL